MIPSFASLLPESAMEVLIGASTASPYPPSFDNSPAIFGLALFARLLLLTLGAATFVRIRARNCIERVPSNHPVFYHRTMVQCFLAATCFGSLSDVLTYLFWGEVSNGAIAVVLVLSRVLDALTMFPFLMALFVPVWLVVLQRRQLVTVAPTTLINGVVHDVRATWDSPTIPLALLVYCAVASLLVTGGKYVFWLEHAAAL